ncbi:MAG: hypothetical protein AAGD11_07635 [Planctomycetota bacterium]
MNAQNRKVPPQPSWYPGTADDWNDFLAIIELDQIGGCVQWDPLDLPGLIADTARVLRAAAEQDSQLRRRDAAHQRAVRIARRILRSHPTTAKRIIDESE